MTSEELIAHLNKLPRGSSVGRLDGKKYSASKSVSGNGRRIKFYAEELGGTNIISFNMYRTARQGWALKPCEISSGKIFDFLERFIPDGEGHASK